MEKLQLGRNRKTDAEKPRMDPLMRALKALHSAGSPEAMTPEELEHQRRSQAQAVQCLRLYNASVEGIAPQGKQQQIQCRAGIAHPNAADVEHGQHPAGISHPNDRKNQDHRQQLFLVPFHRANLSLSLWSVGKVCSDARSHFRGFLSSVSLGSGRSRAEIGRRVEDIVAQFPKLHKAL